MRFEQLERFILAKKYFGVRGTLNNDSSTYKKMGLELPPLSPPTQALKMP